MLIYEIRRALDGTLMVTVHPMGQPQRNQLLPHVAIHSPTGFGIGYAGSGPADLALSLLAHHFCESPRQIQEEWKGNLTRHSLALELYQHFKHDVLAGLRVGAGEHYQLTSKMIEEWLRDCRALRSSKS